MSYGLLDLGNSLESQGRAGLKSAAEQNHQRQMANDQIERQEDAEDAQIMSTSLGMGLDKAYSNYAANEAAKSASLQANPMTTTQIGGEAVQVQTLDGATGSYASSPVSTTVGAEGAVTEAIAASPVDTSIANGLSSATSTTTGTAATGTATTGAATTGAATTGAATTGAATTGAATTGAAATGAAATGAVTTGAATTGAAATGAAATGAVTTGAVTTGAAATGSAASAAAGASMFGPVGWAVAAGLLAASIL